MARDTKIMLRIIFLGTAIFFVWVAFGLNVAEAALIGKPPTNLGLVGYWSMNEGTGARAGDYSGKRNEGILANGPTWVDGKRGKALNFDGVDDVVNLGSPTALDDPGGLNGPRTITAWIYPTGWGEGNFGRIFETGASIGWRFLLENVSPDLATLNGTITATTNAVANAADNTIVLNQWQFVAMTWAGTIGTNAPKLYKNGVETSYDVAPTAGSGTYASDAAVNKTIGNRDNAGGDRTFQGKIDEVRIYNRALSATEIKTLYKSGTTKFTASPTNLGLVGYWPMNEGTSTIAGDFSGKGNNGTLTNMAFPATATSGWTTAGKRGGALNFDGVDDYVKVTQSSSINSLAAMTVSAWIKPNSAGQGNFAKIIAKDSNTGASAWTFQVNNAANCTSGATVNYFVFSKNNSANTAPFAYRCTANNTMIVGSWQHAVATWDGTTGTAGVHIYVNGVETTYSGTLTSSGSAGTDSTLNLFIGNRSAGDRTFDGLIDEVRVYNRALSAAEIQTLYQSDYAKINAPQNSQITNGLVGLWSFNGPDMSGVTAYDRSGQGNNGTLTNGPTRAIGKIGQALNFDGANDYVNIGNKTLVNTGQNITLSAWIKRSNTSSGMIVAKGPAVEATFGTEYSVNVGTYVTYRETPNYGRSHRGNTTLPLNTWVHVVVTRIWGATTPTIYVNGVVETLTLTDGSWPTYGTTPIANNVTVGSISTAQFFPGLIDEVRVYNRALTPAEIKRLYNMGR